MIWILFGLAAAAAAYQALALAACLRHAARREPAARYAPPVSILKPLRGLDEGFYEAIRSHALQDYPAYEILFGVSDPTDPALAEIERLKTEFPGAAIRVLVSDACAPNRKAGVLIDLAAAARYPVLLVNDSDIRVPPDYLRTVAAPLQAASIGVVTCLYRARAQRWAGRFEALGIATDFAPSVLVAPLVGVSEFALGSTMVFRAADLKRIGGFEAIADYLADDYQLSRRIRGLGLTVRLSALAVETSLPDQSWGDVWRHQVRWARTIRVSRGDGYIGMPVTHASLWALLLALAGHGWAAAGLLALRMASGVTGALAIGDYASARLFPLIPLRDLWGVAVWIAGLFGKTVEWRGRRLSLDREGRIIKERPGA